MHRGALSGILHAKDKSDYGVKKKHKHKNKNTKTKYMPSSRLNSQLNLLTEILHDEERAIIEKITQLQGIN